MRSFHISALNDINGQSAAAGFPYPANASFSHFVHDFLQDVLPADTVEIINLGIAATNSYTMVDMVDEVISQRPDAILIYGGHNEYYGAMGVGSAETLGSTPSLVRVYLKLQRFKSFLLLRNSLTRLGLIPSSGTAADSAATRMETVVRDQR